ncbi:MAG: hypothetical protein CVV44_06660 [Spirochaetae bacterium HGW-Spirochaetae-1]|nr:MAG: hypothetical protein CVV44_06660 [Spirochaetae bacterium HGW-Spirochaetae-1]
MVKKLSNYIVLSFVIIVTIISMANLNSVAVKILFFTFEVPLIFLIYLLVIIGFLAGYLTKGIMDHRKKKESDQ